jgi:hypothetical protein
MAKRKTKEEKLTEAGDKVFNILKKSSGYYVWTPFTSPDGVYKEWLFRAPRTDLLDNAWLLEEMPVVIHICRPIELIDAIEKGDKERTIAHSAYVKRITTREDKFRLGQICLRCDTKMDEKLFKRLDGFCTIFNAKKSMS